MSNYKFSIKLINYYIFFSLFFFSISIVNLNFYTWYYPNENTLTNIVKNHILTDIYIGSNNQKLSLNILFYSTGLFIIDKNRTNDPKDYIYENNKYFDTNSSSTFKIINYKDIEKVKGLDFNFKREIRSIRCTDSIIFKDNENNNIIVKDIKFFLAKKLTKLPYGAGFIGLDLNNRYFSTWQYSGFISDLFKKQIIANENFLISFNSYKEGKVIIGLENIPNKNNNYEEYKLYEYKWEIAINGIEYSPEKIEKDAKINFKININPIIGNIFYTNYILENFFNKYNLFDKKNPICENIIYDIYNITICNKLIEKYLDKFPDLSFNFNNHKILFKAKELFKKLDYLDEEKNIGKKINKNNLNEKDQRYIFMIFSNNFRIAYSAQTEWKLGKIFFEKVDLYFYSEKFKIGLLFKDSPNFQQNEILIFSMKKSLLLFIIINLICVGSFYLYYLILKKINNKKNKLIKSKRKNNTDEDNCIYEEMKDIDKN